MTAKYNDFKIGDRVQTVPSFSEQVDANRKGMVVDIEDPDTPYPILVLLDGDDDCDYWPMKPEELILINSDNEGTEHDS